MRTHYSSYQAVEEFVDELSRCGVRHVCISPGARSTPLALAMARHPALRSWSHIDERSGAFFALGMAKASRRPVAVVCTSGTAAANFLPAVVEAAHAGVPLLVLTADRPAELRDCGAGQTIDQIKLYGTFPKWFVEVGGAESGWRYFRALASRAVATARAAPAGPVHLNFPFREPLMPDGATLASATAHRDTGRPASQPYTRLHDAERLPAAATLDELAALLAAAPHGLIACGHSNAGGHFAAAVARLARVADYPILADPTSQVRSGAHDTGLVIDTYDVLLRDADFAAHAAPDLVLRIGPVPTSKAFRQFLEQHGTCAQVVVDSPGLWNDPVHTAVAVLHADPQKTCEALADRLSRRGQEGARAGSSTWLARWTEAGRRARRALDELTGEMRELFEGRVFAELSALLPDGACLYVGNSMPMRDLEVFWPAGGSAVRFLCNRGANGIDGFLSSGLGAAAVSDAPLVMVTGDLGFYHDLNGLLAAKRYELHATIIVLNNDGGGIFSYLPQVECAEVFDDYFRTPHGLDFRGAVEMYGCGFTRVGSWEQFRDAVAAGLRERGTSVVEVPIDHARSVPLHRKIWAAAARAAAAVG